MFDRIFHRFNSQPKKSISIESPRLPKPISNNFFSQIFNHVPKIQRHSHHTHITVRGLHQKSHVYPKEILLPEEVTLKNIASSEDTEFRVTNSELELIQKIEDGYTEGEEISFAIGLRQTLLTEAYGKIRVPSTGLYALILKCLRTYHTPRSKYEDCDGIRGFLPSYIFHAVKMKTEYIQSHESTLTAEDMIDLDRALLLDAADIIKAWEDNSHQNSKIKELFDLRQTEIFESFKKEIKRGRQNRFLQTRIIPLPSAKSNKAAMIEFFEEKSKKLHSQNAKEKAKDLLQQLKPGQCKMRFALTDGGDHIYTDFFAADSQGNMSHFSGMGDLIWDMEEETKVMFHGNQLQWIELPALSMKENSAVDTLEKLQNSELIYKNQFENDLKTHWQICNKIEKKIEKHKAYFESLISAGYTELNGLFYSFVKENNGHLFSDFKNAEPITIKSIESYLQNNLNLNYLDLQKFLDEQKVLFSEKYLRAKKLHPKLNYFTLSKDQLPCAATAKTVMDMAGYHFNAWRTLPIGPVNVAKYASEFTLDTLSKATDGFKTAGNIFQHDSHDSQEENDLISILIWRLELKRHDHEFFTRAFASTQKLDLLKEKFGKKETLSALNSDQLLAAIDSVLADPCMNGHFFNRGGGFTGARLREIKQRILSKKNPINYSTFS